MLSKILISLLFIGSIGLASCAHHRGGHNCCGCSDCKTTCKDKCEGKCGDKKDCCGKDGCDVPDKTKKDEKKDEKK